ncbi:MAG: response regulator [Planctomycetes bacterium]|nr:response regulator [Planctomycetota bacterium]
MRPRGEKDVLSAEELEILLGSEPLEEAPGCSRISEGPPPSAPRILILAGDRKAALELKGQIEHLGLETTLRRNPFDALDALRWRRHDLVISELDLWADDGRLLLDRIEASGEETPVVFVGAGAEETRRRALRAGAFQGLGCPIEVHDIHPLLETLGLVAAAERIAPDRGEQASLSEERAWLLFFFELRRAWRSSQDTEGRLRALHESFVRLLGARGALTAERTADGFRIHLPESAGGDVSRRRASSRGMGELFENLVEAGGAERPCSIFRIAIDVPSPRGALFLASFPGDAPDERSVYAEELRQVLCGLLRR